MRLILGLTLAITCSVPAQIPLKQLLVKAKQGDLISEIAVADAYYNGAGTAQNYGKAAEWYSKAGHAGSAYAYYMLGEEYYFGKLPETKGLLHIPAPDAERDIALARINMLMAATENYGPACAWMGWYYEEGYRMGHSDIQSSSSTTIHEPESTSGGGFAGGFARAIADRNGANNATVHTQSSTTVLGGPQYEEAALWYRRGADQNDMGSQYNLGRLYEQGLGVPKDPALALKWYSAAALQGNANAKARVELIKEQLGQTTR